VAGRKHRWARSELQAGHDTDLETGRTRSRLTLELFQTSPRRGGDAADALWREMQCRITGKDRP
jgi:hypothetical protein